MEEQSKNLIPQRLNDYLDDLDKLSTDDEKTKAKAYIDPDEKGVVILTTHLSKGLEFDIVFAIGLLKRKSIDDDLIPIEKDGKRLLATVKNDDPRFLEHCKECDAEKMRQLYVALTRAKEKLYIPVLIDPSPKPVPFGSASSIDLFIARLNSDATNYEELYQRISTQDGIALASFVAQHSEIMSITLLDCPKTPSVRIKTEKPSLITPKTIEFAYNPLFIQSFTSLSLETSIRDNKFMQDVGSTAVEKLTAPNDFECELKTEHTLPAGNETGVILHKIFEHLPFDCTLNMTSYKSLKPLIVPYLKGTAYASWEDVIAKIVFHTFKTPLGVHERFCLADVHPNKVYRETEFLYPCDLEHEMLIETLAKPGFLKGVVDVFFEHQGKYFLLDWKSNWLGPSIEYYSQHNLQLAMSANKYDLQAKIYCEAFRRYLKLFDSRPFEEIFGGIYYCFLRGIGHSTGIFHFSQTNAEME